jgi:glycosyltransferase involved in cell wall biosynthesis
MTTLVGELTTAGSRETAPCARPAGEVEGIEVEDAGPLEPATCPTHDLVEREPGPIGPEAANQLYWEPGVGSTCARTDREPVGLPDPRIVKPSVFREHLPERPCAVDHPLSFPPVMREPPARTSTRREEAMNVLTILPSTRADELAIGMVGTYPPTRCGIATFTASLAGALTRFSRADVRVVSSVEREGAAQHPPEVVADLVAGSATSREDAAEALDGCDAVVVQHEFGIYGGRDGSEIVDLVSLVEAPVITVLHTVLSTPSAGQRDVVDALVEHSSALVVQSATARSRLLAAHDVDPRRVHLIPHGARPNLSVPPALGRVDRPPTVLTWGLIGPGKGIELAIEAIAMLGDLPYPPRYLVLGQTHPKVVASEGERYRESLVAKARLLGVEDRVEFDDTYNGTDEILARVRDADIVLLPYHSREQVVSGVLIEAIASSRPVVATAFPHARELLAAGSGVVVPHGDSAAIAAAIRMLCTDEVRSARVVAAARRQAPTLFWETVARSYGRLAVSVGTGTRRTEVAV